MYVDGKVGHWIVLSTTDCTNGEVKVYDSLYTSVNDDTHAAIAALINSKSPQQASQLSDSPTDTIVVATTKIQIAVIMGTIGHKSLLQFRDCQNLTLTTYLKHLGKMAWVTLTLTSTSTTTLQRVSSPDQLLVSYKMLYTN